MIRQLETSILFVLGNILFLILSNVHGFVMPSSKRLLRHSTTSIQEGIGVGIDLGTTHSAVSILKGGVPIILDIEGNGRTMPSVVHLDGDIILVGKEAIEGDVDHPLGTYRNV